MRSLRCGLLILASFWASAALASTFVVNSTADSPDVVPGDGACGTDAGACTLRAAFMEANALPGHDTIEVPAGTYALTIPSDPSDPYWYRDDSRGDLELVGDATVIGEGPGMTVIDASGLGDRVLTVFGESFSGTDVVEIVGVTMTGGTTEYGGGCVQYDGYGTLTIRESLVTGCLADGAPGGGVYLYSRARKGRMFVIDSTISDNVGQSGGIASHWGTLELAHSSVTGNRAKDDDDPLRAKFGGGISLAGGSFRAFDSVISNNVAERRGGAIYAGQAEIFLERTTISDNVALDTTGGDGIGGAMVLDRVTLDVLNSTISSNFAEAYGGGIVSWRGTHFQILFSTIAENRSLVGGSGAGMLMLNVYTGVDRRRQVFRGSIIAGNTAAGIEHNCTNDYDVQSLGYNVDGDGTCALEHATDRPSLDPDLAPLAANGGLGETHGLYMGSIAIDLVPNDQCAVYAYDNDGDGRIDEDPIDGVNNDGDYLTDEDPAEPLETDQRGFLRPYGLACDAGAFEGEVEVEVEDVIGALIVDVEELIASGEINRGRGRSLIAELQVALWFLEFNNGERIAINRIELFIIKVERLVEKGDLDPDLGEELLRKARTILMLLQE